MTWRERPICLDCQRTLHGPGTGPLGPALPTPVPRGVRDRPRCVLCGWVASPAATMRLWRDEGPPERPPEAA